MQRRRRRVFIDPELRCILSAYWVYVGVPQRHAFCGSGSDDLLLSL